MLDVILQSLREVDGVQGAMIVDPVAAVLAHNAHAIYDIAVLQQVARSVVNAVDSVQLIQDEWDVVTVHFGEGKLVLRSLKTAGPKPRRHVLVVIGDTTLNVAFLGVALRVAAAKLATAFDDIPARTTPGPSVQVAPSSGGTSRIPLPAPSGPEPARPRSTRSGTGTAAGIDGSGVETADAASSAFLAACTIALTTSLGPIAKVFVRDAVRKICNGRAFSRADGPTLASQLAAMIDNVNDRATFQRATRGL